MGVAPRAGHVERPFDERVRERAPIFARDVGERAAGPTAVAGQLRNAERELILRALRESRGVIGGPQGAAASLGVKRTTLQSKMRKLGITRPSF